MHKNFVRTQKLEKLAVHAVLSLFCKICGELRGHLKSRMFELLTQKQAVRPRLHDLDFVSMLTAFQRLSKLGIKNLEACDQWMFVHYCRQCKWDQNGSNRFCVIPGEQDISKLPNNGDDSIRSVKHLSLQFHKVTLTACNCRRRSLQ